MMYVGLDVHKNVCYGTVMNEKGKVAKQTKFTNDPEGVEAFMEGLDEAQVAMEAGYCWQPIYDAARACTRTFLPNLPIGGHSGCLDTVWEPHSGYSHPNSRKSITCLGAGFEISSTMRWSTLLGPPRGAPHPSHRSFHGGVFTASGLGRGLVLPGCPLGLPG